MTVAAKAETISEDLRRVARFTLAARENTAHSSCPRMGDYRRHARSATLVERPIGNRHARIDDDIRVGYEKDRWHDCCLPNCRYIQLRCRSVAAPKGILL
jgi:hypothetical protein